jgi:hypothetical protein
MMSQTSKHELVAEVRTRYTLGNRTARCQILDALMATTGYRSKSAIWLLNRPSKRSVRRRREAGIGQQSIQPGILGRRLPQSLDIAAVQSAIRAPPAVKRLFSDALLAAQVRDRLLTLLCFPQDTDDLFSENRSCCT